VRARQESLHGDHDLTSSRYNRPVRASVVATGPRAATERHLTGRSQSFLLRLARFGPYGYLLPSLGFLAFFTFWPFAYSLVLSAQRWDFLSPNRPFVGTANYQALLTSTEFWNSVRVTALFTLATVPVRMVLALGLAHLLLREDGRTRALRAVFFLPVVSSAVATGVIFSWLFNTDLGLVNALLGALGLGPLAWLRTPDLALWVIALANLWKQLGYDLLVYIAGLLAIPETYRDAARVDGAAPWQIFRFVTLPLLLPTTFFLLVVSVLDSFQSFTLVNVITGGGPALATDVIVNLLYRTAFVIFDIGKASALAVLLLLLLVALTVTQFYLVGRRVRYENA
jgi:multiple sugar transport system permease protein/sn-glycerol 3-phosphate transport system permease protein